MPRLRLLTLLLAALEDPVYYLDAFELQPQPRHGWTTFSTLPCWPAADATAGAALGSLRGRWWRLPAPQACVLALESGSFADCRPLRHAILQRQAESCRWSR